MQFALSEEQTAIWDMSHAFGQDNIAPFAREWELAGSIPKKPLAQSCRIGSGRNLCQ